MPAASTTTPSPTGHQTVTPRNIHFDTSSAAHSATWMGGDRVATAVFNALSLTFPDGERLFMDAVRSYRDRLDGPLLAEANAFIAQEAIHSREHVGLNAGLDAAHYPVATIERMMRKRLEFLRGRGPVAMLAITIALEHFTAMMAELFLADPAFWDGTDPALVRLWQWHAMEETEHKAVAFDVFRHISRDWTPRQRYRVRVQAMVATTIFFNLNIIRYASMLLAADGMNRWAARARVVGYLFGKPGLFRRSWSAYADWYSPDFHPWHHDNRALLDTWRGAFAPEAVAA